MSDDKIKVYMGDVPVGTVLSLNYTPSGLQVYANLTEPRAIDLANGKTGLLSMSSFSCDLGAVSDPEPEEPMVLKYDVVQDGMVVGKITQPITEEQDRVIRSFFKLNQITSLGTLYLDPKPIKKD